MNQTWLGIDPGLATVGWAFLSEISAQDIRLLDLNRRFVRYSAACR
ncbi:hypothetical protein [Myxosarcina sp. GI1(2024)]